MYWCKMEGDILGNQGIHYIKSEKKIQSTIVRSVACIDNGGLKENYVFLTWPGFEFNKTYQSLT